jgi:hypothetical protein
MTKQQTKAQQTKAHKALVARNEADLVRRVLGKFGRNLIAIAWKRNLDAALVEVLDLAADLEQFANDTLLERHLEETDKLLLEKLNAKAETGIDKAETR